MVLAIVVNVHDDGCDCGTCTQTLNAILQIGFQGGFSVPNDCSVVTTQKDVLASGIVSCVDSHYLLFTCDRVYTHESHVIHSGHVCPGREEADISLGLHDSGTDDRH